MLVLLLFGALHFYLIWFGDILFGYALIGMVAWFFRKHAAEHADRSAASTFVLVAVPDDGRHGGQRREPRSQPLPEPGASAETLRSWNEMTAWVRVPTAAELDRADRPRSSAPGPGSRIIS